MPSKALFPFLAALELEQEAKSIYLLEFYLGLVLKCYMTSQLQMGQ